MPFGHAENINQLWAAVLVEELARLEVTRFYISPGSRSTPLTLAAARNPRVQTVVCYDERRAAFMALGYARGARKPAVLVCTSGTAAANYYPAIIEAASEQLPMLVLSADRPPELRDTGANQTIDQQSLFGRYSAFFMDMPAPDENVPLAYLLSTVDQAVYQTRMPRAGVAHLNCMFREPLAPSPEKIDEAYLQHVGSWGQSERPFTRIVAGQPRPQTEIITELQKNIQDSPVRMLVIGRLNSKAERCAARIIAKKFNGVVFADITSGLRLDANMPNLIGTFDLLLLSSAVKKQLAGAMVLHLGGKYVSKRLRQFLASHEGRQVQVSDNRSRLDPTLSLDIRIECSLSVLAEALVPVSPASSLLLFFKQADQKAAKEISVLQNEPGPVNEISIARSVSRLIPDGDALFLSSSMPIRDMDMYGLTRRNGLRDVAANRGASGIDGIISSALGYSLALQKPLTLIIGDLAFLHDLTALNALRSHAYPVSIVLINNGGGGIFSFLPIAEYTKLFEPFFATPHDLTFADVARQFGVDYFKPTDLKAFESVCQLTGQQKKSCIIEVQTDRQENVRLHKKMQQMIKTLFDFQ